MLGFLGRFVVCLFCTFSIFLYNKKEYLRASLAAR